VVSVLAQKTPATSPRAPKIGLNEKVTYTSSVGRLRSKNIRMSSDQLAWPVVRTRSIIGPIVGQISAHASRPERPSTAGCLVGPRNETYASL
jgi:hypothetical protein